MSQKYDSLSDIWKMKRRGQRDSDRHKQLVEKAIRKNGKDIVTEYNIIKSDGNKKIKIPIRFLDQYKFKYGSLNKNGGTGQGLDGKPGTRYNKGGQQGDGAGAAGNQEGEKLFGVEITIDELVDILLDELNLPWMDPKNSSEVEVETEEFSTIDKNGILPNLDLKRTLIKNIQRNAAKGEAYVGDFSKEDFRYRSWEDDKEYHSNAAVYLMMDRSASMDIEKTMIGKAFYFWMVQFIKRRYKKVHLIFIAHDTTAFIVDEDDFFKVLPSGGTICSSAYKLAYEHIKLNHQPDRWNNYVFEMSDGDNWSTDNAVCVEYAEKLLPLVTAMGYGEIILKGQSNPWQNKEDLLSYVFNSKIKRTRFLSMNFKSKDDVFEGLKKFFNINSTNDKEKR